MMLLYIILVVLLSFFVVFFHGSPLFCHFLYWCVDELLEIKFFIDLNTQIFHRRHSNNLFFINYQTRSSIFDVASPSSHYYVLGLAYNQRYLIEFQPIWKVLQVTIQFLHGLLNTGARNRQQCIVSKQIIFTFSDCWSKAPTHYLFYSEET
jgi:hypothetical protein